MYFWNSYPFVRFTIALIMGILCYDHFPSIWAQYQWKVISGILLLSVLIYFSRKYSFYKLRHFNGLLALLIISFLGGYFTMIKYHQQEKNHYLNTNKEVSGFIGIITSPVNERTNHHRYNFKLLQVIDENDSIIPTSGIIHLYIKKDSSTQSLLYGDKLAVYGKYHPVPGPDNPFEFNYKQYLERQNIYAHAFVDHDQFKVVSNEPPSRFFQWAYDLRTASSEVIDKYIQQPRENGIAKALLLGIKDHLDNDVKRAYSSAGAMHVLAVSGLHVGIIYLIVQLLFGKLKQTGRLGKYAFGIISILLIWLYATVTGLSPSVLRASTMFSLVAFSQASAREGNIYNTLGFAAFILLCVDPYLIYSVGFQLSFAAVIGIVYLQPKLYRLLSFRIVLFDKAWAITCVSIAAQLATFPLSAYYFHQFPTYFLVSNLLVIPAASILLIGGMSMLLIESILPALAKIIGYCLAKLMWGINELIGLVHFFPNSLIEWIFLDQVGLFLTYGIVLTFIAGFHFRSFKTLTISSSLFILFLFWNLTTHQNQSRRHELVFYEVSDKTAIDYIQGHSADLYIDGFNDSDLELLAFQINPHRLASHLDPIEYSISNLDSDTSNSAIKATSIGDKKIIIFDSTTYHIDFHQFITADLVIINNQAVKSLEWLKKHFQAELVIIGNKNPGYYSRKMKQQAAELNLNIHSLKEDGALTIDLKNGIKKERTITPALFTTNPD
ncbi:competence protein ComEC [Ekhidna lutea]|uniref:Competence protein ComEC n=1 Tax=Ekhidna lutea TaxID=447679 RepID=A0A239KFH7_EKHLU|nr:ComEC/Rec2 family competence protein [Ekhidna lutea]SNT16740.1 competence protein ComEC [Ekhidna lutea]